MALEVIPSEDEHRLFPVHQHLIVEKGVYIIEAGYLLHSGDPNMLWSPDHGILAYLTNDS